MIYWGILLECTKEGVTMPAHEKRVLSLDGLRGLGALMVFPVSYTHLVGALIFVAAFRAYAVIRNKGGRRLSDEGLDVWRSREDDRRS